MGDHRIYFTVYVLVAVFSIINGVKDLPKYFPNCHRFDKNLNSCLIDATEKVKPFLAKGVPELNIPVFEPFIIPEIKLAQGTSALNFKAVLHNTEIYGLTNYTFSRFDFDVPNLQFFCDATINNLRLKGNYTVTGKILIAPIVGSGTFTASVENANATVYQKVKVEKRKGGNEFIVPTLTNSSIHVSGPKANLKGLFNDNSELSAITNKVIDDNVNELFEDLRPVLEKVMSEILEDLLFKAIEGQIPFQKLYPPIE